VARGEPLFGLRPLGPHSVDQFTLALGIRTPAEQASIALAATGDNHECCEPPLYYILVGGWHMLGKWFFWKPNLLPYWDRFANCFIVAAIVWIGYRISKRMIPNVNGLLVPIFLALLPQSDFYALNNDALMPIVFGVFLLILLAFRERPSLLLAFLCGIALSSCIWTKTTSVPLVVVGVVGVSISIIRTDKVFRFAPATACGLMTVIPLLWLNQQAFGHLTGAFTKMQMQGQTIRPVSQWLSHPIFRPSGFVSYWTELTNFYWLGEMPLNHWEGQSLFNVPYLFVWLCPLLTAIIIAASARLRLCLACFAASVLFLGLFSAVTNFGIRSTPSAWWSFPGFVGGRLMIGTLIPFALMAADVLSRVRSTRIRITGLLSVMLFLNAISAWMLADCFTGKYNSLFTQFR
jgi:hypothetical protein